MLPFNLTLTRADGNFLAEFPDGAAKDWFYPIRNYVQVRVRWTKYPGYLMLQHRSR